MCLSSARFTSVNTLDYYIYYFLFLFYVTASVAFIEKKQAFFVTISITDGKIFNFIYVYSLNKFNLFISKTQ